MDFLKQQKRLQQHKRQLNNVRQFRQLPIKCLASSLDFILYLCDKFYTILQIYLHFQIESALQLSTEAACIFTLIMLLIDSNVVHKA